MIAYPYGACSLTLVKVSSYTKPTYPCSMSQYSSMRSSHPRGRFFHSNTDM